MVQAATSRLSTMIFRGRRAFLLLGESHRDGVPEGAHGIFGLVLLSLVLYVLNPNQLINLIQNRLIKQLGADFESRRIHDVEVWLLDLLDYFVSLVEEGGFTYFVQTDLVKPILKF